MSAELGRVAYDAYRARRGGVAYDGTAIPEWDALQPEICEAWGAAAAAVIGARSPQPAGTIDLDAARKTASEAQERAEKASAPPWRPCQANADEGGCVCGLVWSVPEDRALFAASEYVDLDETSHAKRMLNVTFAAHARTDIPALAALILAMADRIAYLENEVHNHRVARNL